MAVIAVAKTNLLKGHASLGAKVSIGVGLGFTFGSLSNTSRMRTADASARDTRITNILTIISDINVCIK